jgi:uncharacterized protein HemX
MADYLKKHKQIPAFAAALLMSLIVGLSILSIGANAITNPNSTPVQNEPSTPQVSNVSRDDMQKLQDLVAQYQSREQQYQTELNQAAEQLNQADASLQQYQQLFAALQNAGVIRVTSDGQILIPRSRFGGEDDGHESHEGNGF